ncbi:MAG: hypothetical protein KF886_18695 [Candidatus Hydrogenedentes bacterium]|nr:hypothetical protein [Candidatus Hydrogenedentota bacterium]
MRKRIQRWIPAGRATACWAVFAAYGIAVLLAALHPATHHGGHPADTEATAHTIVLLTSLDGDHDHGCDTAVTCAACAAMKRTAGAFEAVLAVDRCRPAHRPMPVIQPPLSQWRPLHIAQRAPPRDV